MARMAMWFGLALSLGIALGEAGLAESPNQESPLGINLFKVRPYGRELALADLLATRGAWRVGGAGNTPITLDSEGWPTSLAPGQWVEVQLLTGFGGHIPPGEFAARWEGKGRLKWIGASVVETAPGRARVTLSPSAPIHGLRIVASDAISPIRRVRLILPGADPSGPAGSFNPRFLARWSKFRVVRFMDWMETNGSRVSKWSERTLASQPQGTHNGVSIELMIELSNRLHAEPWFCMPHGANDEYVAQFAKLVRQRLDPGLRPWIEYSNEVWNGQFEQAEHARRSGLAAGLATREREAAARFYSQRSVELFSIWQREFGGSERIVRVLAGQFGNVRMNREILTWQDAAKHSDVFAVGAYFGGRLTRRDGGRLAALALPELAAELRAEIKAQRKLLREMAALAKAFGLPLVAYEGGQHLRGDARIPGLTEQLAAANRAPEMGDLYARQLAAWKEEGGTLFVHFSSVSGYNENGSWGALEWWDQPTSPKYQALLEFIAKHRKWWKGRP